jgi:hypothetical protein
MAKCPNKYELEFHSDMWTELTSPNKRPSTKTKTPTQHSIVRAITPDSGKDERCLGYKLRRFYIRVLICVFVPPVVTMIYSDLETVPYPGKSQERDTKWV